MTALKSSEFEMTTFSIAARCERTGMLGVAVATAVPGVGGNCPFVAAGVGAIATQAWVNPYLGIDGLALLRRGLTAKECVNQLVAGDVKPEQRQLGIVDAAGGSAAHTGTGCSAAFADATGPNYAIQGNMLADAEVVTAMARTFVSSRETSLPERLMLALEAGQTAGGDKRGRQSAALRVAWREEYPYVDLRVDEHVDPVLELRRVFEIAKHELIPFVETFPTRLNPAGARDTAVWELLERSPAARARPRADFTSSELSNHSPTC